MAEPLTIAGTVLSGVAPMIGIAAALYVRAQGTTPAPQSGAREALYPQPSQPSLAGMDTAALVGRIVALETTAANAEGIEAMAGARGRRSSKGASTPSTSATALDHPPRVALHVGPQRSALQTIPPSRVPTERALYGPHPSQGRPRPLPGPLRRRGFLFPWPRIGPTAVSG